MSILGIILGILGGFFGAIAEGEEGLLLGLVLGYCFGAIIQLTTRVKHLERRVKQIPLTRESIKVEPETESVDKTEKPVVEPTMYQTDTEESQEPKAAMQKPHTPVTPRERDEVSPDSHDTKDTGVPLAPTWQQGETIVDKLIKHIKTFFTDGNVVLKVGLIVLFFGVGFLMKYAYAHSMLPAWARLVGAGVLGIVLLVFGWRVRERKQVYALLLQGGGVGVLYLTVFAAAKLYAMIPIGMAFFIMVAFVILSGILAILQNAKYLAIYGAVGGFLAPVLASTGSGNHVMLFSFYALLNAGIVGIAWYRSWRILNLVGFVFTFVIGSLWGAKYYRPEFFASVEPFLIIFFVFFVVIAVLFAYRQPPKLKGYVDSTLVFGVPIIAFALQSALVRDMEYGMAFSALAISTFYIFLASSLWRRGPEGMRLLTEAFLALGVVFGSLAIPLALDGRWTAAAWALEGAAIIWIGVRQDRMLARAFGLLLQAGSGFFFLADVSMPVRDIPVLNGMYMGSLTIALAGLFSSYYLYRNREGLRDWEQAFHVPLLVWGLLWWFGAGIHEIGVHINNDKLAVVSTLLFITSSLLFAHVVERKLQWKTLIVPIFGQMYAILLVMWMMFLLGFKHPMVYYGWFVLPAAFSAQYYLLYRYRDQLSETVQKWQHIISFWLLLSFVSWEAAWAVDELIKGSHAWRDVMYVLTPALIMFLLLTQGKNIKWPVARHYEWYVGQAALPVMFILGITAMGYAILHQGNPWPLVYIPLINPVDFMVGFLLYLLVVWRYQMKKQGVTVFNHSSLQSLPYVIAAMAFVLLNGMIARTIHHWFDVPYNVTRLLHAVEFKATISVVWTMVALSTMLYASRKSKREMWFAGLGLFAIVVAKLFLFDISRDNTLAIIISLLVVGGLTVVFGYYLSPLPPRLDESDGMEKEENA